MLSSENEIIKSVYFESELKIKKRSRTVGSHFRTDLKKLMNILYSKNPSYVRCIKSNHLKEPSKFV
jgi:myosin-1